MDKELLKQMKKYDLQMKKLKQQKNMTMEDKVQAEVLKRMKRLQLHGNVARDFKRKTRLLNYSEPQRFGSMLAGILYWVEDEEILNKIKEVETQNNITVYHLIHNYTEFGELYSMLYVGNDDENYQDDNELLNEGLQYAYVWNKDYENCSEFGLIGIKPSAGGLIRIS